MKKRLLFIFCITSVWLLIGNPASGWWAGGHGILTRASVKSLPEDVPPFFRHQEKMIAHCAFDPDVAKSRDTPHLRGMEHPEHYIDLELLQGRPLPKSRYELVKLCAEMGIAPESVGFLPYALAEWTERLAVAFAEHRKWPDNPFIQDKCLVYAGFIAHYAQDMCQPLHLTVHYDGKVKADGSSSKTGIHEKVDALIEYLAFKPDDLARNQKINPLDDLMGGILKQVKTVRSLIDRIYELETRLPAATLEGERKADMKVVEFATGRARESVRFTASLYLTAWNLSQKVQMPNWLNRLKTDAEEAGEAGEAGGKDQSGDEAMRQ